MPDLVQHILQIVALLAARSKTFQTCTWSSVPLFSKLSRAPNISDKLDHKPASSLIAVHHSFPGVSRKHWSWYHKLYYYCIWRCSCIPLFPFDLCRHRVLGSIGDDILSWTITALHFSKWGCSCTTSVSLWLLSSVYYSLLYSHISCTLSLHLRSATLASASGWSLVTILEYTKRNKCHERDSINLKCV